MAKRRSRPDRGRRVETTDATPTPARGGGGRRAFVWASIAAGAALVATLAMLFARRAGPETSGAAEPASAADFVGSASCRSCHAAEYASWEGSQHDRAMQHARPGAVLGDFSGAAFEEGGVQSTFLARDGKYFVRTDASDGTVREFEIKYTFGVEPIQQYLVELEGGRVQALSVAWDSRPRQEGGQRWFHLYPGEGIDHTDEFHWTGRQQNWNFMCADCHSTDVRKNYDVAEDRFETAWSEINVGCEACHGPGSEHRRWAESSRVLRALLWRDDGLQIRLDEREGVRWGVAGGTGKPVRSRARESDREVSLCAQCHSLREQLAPGFAEGGGELADHYAPALLMPGLYHPDGQQRAEVYVYGSFLQSRMYHAGVTCSDCHDPHSQRVRLPGNALCAQCHTPARYDAPDHTLHRAGSEGAQCVACHMPEETYMQIDPRRDHSIRVPRPDQTVALGVPNPCTGCHADREAEWAANRLRQALGRDPVGFQDFAPAFHADERGSPGAADELSRIAATPAEPAIVRASALARLVRHPGRAVAHTASIALSDPDFMVRRAALTVLERLPARERIDLVAPLLRDPSRAVRVQAAWTLASVSSGLSGEVDRDAFARASEEFIAAQRYNADRAESRATLGNFYAQLGRTSEAAAEYRAAIRLAPGLAAGYLHLSDLLRMAGQEADAARTLREGLSRAPADAALHHALGLSLARSGEHGAAVESLGRAASLAPDDPTYAYAYAVALNSSGRGAAAIRVLNEALAMHPTDRDILFALAAFHRDAGRTGQAVDYASRLVRAFPEDAEAQALLRSLRAPSGR
jgi:Flp pilus assembly protein TadD